MPSPPEARDEDPIETKRPSTHVPRTHYTTSCQVDVGSSQAASYRHTGLQLGPTVQLPETTRAGASETPAGVRNLKRQRRRQREVISQMP